MHCIVISGSRNPDGQTARATKALLQGFESAGGTSDIVYLPTQTLERCRQCDDRGWGLCRSEGRCVIEDDFAPIVAKLAEADVAVFATPVYFGDLSESMKAFTDRLRRTSCHGDGKARIEGTPAVCLCVAGGGGGGAPNCCTELDKALRTAGLDVVDAIPVRRQNLEMKCEVCAVTGKWLGTATLGDR